MMDLLFAVLLLLEGRMAKQQASKARHDMAPWPRTACCASFYSVGREISPLGEPHPHRQPYLELAQTSLDMRLSYLLIAASLSAATAASNAPFAATSTAKVALSVPRGGAGRSSSRHKPIRSRGGGQEAAVGGGTASIPNEVFNLVKGIVGVGVLSLPAGIAAFGDAPSAVIPAVGLVAAIGAISAYGFSLIGRVCSYTGARSYREAWDKTVGTETSWIPSVSCTFKTGCAILAYSMVLADSFKALLSTIGFDFGRTNVLLGVTTLVLLPLCLMKNLSSLAPFSLAGIIGMLFTATAMAIRYFGGAYRLAAGEGSPAGKFLSDVSADLQPVFGEKGFSSVLHPSSFILICMLSTAYMAHFNAPKFYLELKNNTIKRFNTVVSTSFGISILIMAAVAAMGFLTFGKATSGLVLNNYAGSDTAMSLSRFAVAFSIVFSYPLVFVGCRDGVLDLLKVDPEKRTNSVLNQVTIAILGVITALAIKVSDLTFVLSFGGATLGNALIYVYPALMFRSAVKDMGDNASPGLKGEVNVAMFTAALGVVLGAIGSVMAIKGLSDH